jgi:hypothetical protein
MKRITLFSGLLILSAAVAAVAFHLWQHGLGKTASAFAAPVELPAQCGLLDDPLARRTMSGALETSLLWECGRQAELGLGSGPHSSLAAWLTLPGLEILVNDPTGDPGSSHPQSETSHAINPNTGTICVA